MYSTVPYHIAEQQWQQHRIINIIIIIVRQAGREEYMKMENICSSTAKDQFERALLQQSALSPHHHHRHHSISFLYALQHTTYSALHTQSQIQTHICWYVCLIPPVLAVICRTEPSEVPASQVPNSQPTQPFICSALRFVIVREKRFQQETFFYVRKEKELFSLEFRLSLVSQLEFVLFVFRMEYLGMFFCSFCCLWFRRI